MNAAVQNNDGETVLEGPGAILKKAREAQQIEITRVASMLHLSLTKLQALEADDYTKLPGPVFVQGYLRNYCRLLGLPVEPVFAAYHVLRPEAVGHGNLKITQLKHEVRSSHILVRMVTWLIIIALIGLFITWWRGYIEWPTQGDKSDPQALSEAGPSLLERQWNRMMNGADSASDGGEKATLQLQQGVEPVLSTGILLPPVVQQDDAIPAESLAPPVLQAESPEVVSFLQQADSALPGESAASETVESTESETAAEMSRLQDRPVAEEAAAEISPLVSEPVIAPAPVIELTFSEPCWVDIRDESGSFRLVGLREAGSRAVFEGQAPYRIKLGNAAAAKLTIDGDAFDLGPYTKGNISTFTLTLDQ